MKSTGSDLNPIRGNSDSAQTAPPPTATDKATTGSDAKEPAVSSRTSPALDTRARPPTSSWVPAPSRSEPTLSPRTSTISPRGFSQRQMTVNTDAKPLNPAMSPTANPPSTSAAPARTTTTTTTTTTVTSSTTTTGVVTSTPAIMTPTPAIREPKALAKRLIQAESKQGTIKLEGGKVKAILRLGAEMDGVNIIQQELQPFMKQHFETPGLHAKLDQVTQSYSAIQPQLAGLYHTLGAKDFARDPRVMALMEPITAPIMDFIFGADRMITSSGLPNAVLELFWAVDDEVVAWFKSNGSGSDADLDLARKNALISFFGTRSFMADWTIGLQSDQSKEPGFYRPLTGFTNTYLNLKLESFAQQLMDSGPAKRALLSKQRAVLSSRPSRREKTRQDSTPGSPRSAPEASALKDNAHRLAAQEQARRKEVDNYCTQRDVPLISRDFFMYFKDEVLGLELTTYREVKGNWDLFCLQSLSLFIAKKEDVGEKVAQDLLALQSKLKEILKTTSDYSKQ